MFFMIINAAVSAIFFVIIVVPPLFIYDPAKHPGESHGPPTAGTAASGGKVTHSVEQKLYMLFVIPACAVANVLFLYFTYYRPIRWVQYRVELNVLDLHNERLVARQQLQASGVSGLPAGVSMFAFTRSNASFWGGADRSAMHSVRSTGQKAAGNAHAAHASGSESAGQELQLKKDFSRRARPKSVDKDAYAHTSFYPEVQRLMEVVEDNFFIPAAAAQRNFGRAVSRLTGQAPPDAASRGPRGLISERSAAVHQQPGFYSSKHDGAVAGANPGEGTSSDTNAHEPVARRVPAMGRRLHKPAGDDLELYGPQRNTSVVLVPSSRNPGRRGSQANSFGHRTRAGLSDSAKRGADHAAEGDGGLSLVHPDRRPHHNRHSREPVHDDEVTE